MQPLDDANGIKADKLPAARYELRVVVITLPILILIRSGTDLMGRSIASEPQKPLKDLPSQVNRARRRRALPRTCAFARRHLPDSALSY